MPTRFTLARSVLFAVLVSAVAVFAIVEGAEPTTVATAAILTVALFGGVEVRELAAARQAITGDVDSKRDDGDQ